ncbi:TrkH family potassium uptake protein [Shimia ponticola]|uniref:TrkH family potassium uptake protein n=1 Tax=Shimia ponticola TaxID=2582893 RepID=UPI0011BE4584|nr:TrkH family potassium uptake protein [Shimia ponticola]
MIDLRPVIYVIGLLVAALGVAMLVPFGLDLWYGTGHAFVFFQSAAITILAGGFLALATQNGIGQGMSLQQTFLLTTSVWVALPLFGALPFMLGATEANFTDAFFEAMSGITTTGSTVFTGLDRLPEGLLAWRAILQWLGGVGIIVVAMVFLPELRVGGMQIFRSEGFDTLGKILPRATEIAQRISVIYVVLTGMCALGFVAVGMPTFDAVMHALTTVATGGFSTHDASFGAFNAGAEYVAVVFMILAALPFVRYVQLLNGSARPILVDSQIRGMLTALAAIAVLLTLWLWLRSEAMTEQAFRKALFNVTSILTGTGFASANYMEWGSFAVVLMFFVGLIGGCAGSTSCSIKVFRYQLLFASIAAQLRQIYSPSGLFTPRYEGRPVSEDVINSVMSFFVIFMVSLGLFSVLLAMTGLDVITSVSGAAAALANIGPGLGDQIGPAGNFGGLNDTAKWLLAGAMVLGRLELMAVFVIFSRTFWRG